MKVRTGADGRKWLVASAKGQHPVGRDVDLPPNAYIEFDYGAEMLGSGGNNPVSRDFRRAAGNILSGITLVDRAGAKYRIEWAMIIEPIPGRIGGPVNGTWHHRFTLPSGASLDANRLPPDGTLRIQSTATQSR